MKLCVVVEDVVRGQLVQVGEQVQPVVRLDVVQPVREESILPRRAVLSK